LRWRIELNEDILALERNFMVRTGHPEIYEELCGQKKLFKLDIHLFAAALAIGVLNDKASEKTASHDKVRLNQLTGEQHREIKEVISILAQLAYTKPDKRARGEAIIAYADGGLELLWADYQTQGVLDLPRILDEAKKKWTQRSQDLLSNIGNEDS
jgi:hypothetical protein